MRQPAGLHGPSPESLSKPERSKAGVSRGLGACPCRAAAERLSSWDRPWLAKTSARRQPGVAKRPKARPRQVGRNTQLKRTPPPESTMRTRTVRYGGRWMCYWLGLAGRNSREDQPGPSQGLAGRTLDNRLPSVDPVRFPSFVCYPVVGLQRLPALWVGPQEACPSEAPGVRAANAGAAAGRHGVRGAAGAVG